MCYSKLNYTSDTKYIFCVRCIDKNKEVIELGRFGGFVTRIKGSGYHTPETDTKQALKKAKRLKLKQEEYEAYQREYRRAKIARAAKEGRMKGAQPPLLSMQGLASAGRGLSHGVSSADKMANAIFGPSPRRQTSQRRGQAITIRVVGASGGSKRSHRTTRKRERSIWEM